MRPYTGSSPGSQILRGLVLERALRGDDGVLGGFGLASD